MQWHKNILSKSLQNKHKIFEVSLDIFNNCILLLTFQILAYTINKNMEILIYTPLSIFSIPYFFYNITLTNFLKSKTISFYLCYGYSIFLSFFQTNSHINDVKIFCATSPSSLSYKNTGSGKLWYVFSFSFILSICDFTNTLSMYELFFSHMLCKMKHPYVTTGMVSRWCPSF